RPARGGSTPTARYAACATRKTRATEPVGGFTKQTGLHTLDEVPSMRLRLQVRQSADKSFSWELTAPVARVGRDPSCELSLQGEGTQSVSWNHARLELHGDGVFITDVGSSNGTYVNGK